MDSKFVGFFALIGGAAALVGNFVPKLGNQYYLIPIGAGISLVIGLLALFSRKY
jgi:uncharacterized membrane protein HdeD (DUF308 family)